METAIGTGSLSQYAALAIVAVRLFNFRAKVNLINKNMICNIIIIMITIFRPGFISIRK